MGKLIITKKQAYMTAKSRIVPVATGKICYKCGAPAAYAFSTQLQNLNDTSIQTMQVNPMGRAYCVRCTESVLKEKAFMLYEGDRIAAEEMYYTAIGRLESADINMYDDKLRQVMDNMLVTATTPGNQKYTSVSEIVIHMILQYNDIDVLLHQVILPPTKQGDSNGSKALNFVLPNEHIILKADSNFDGRRSWRETMDCDEQMISAKNAETNSNDWVVVHVLSRDLEKKGLRWAKNEILGQARDIRRIMKQHAGKLPSNYPILLAHGKFPHKTVIYRSMMKEQEREAEFQQQMAIVCSNCIQCQNRQ